VLREILETVEEMGQGQQQEISMDGIKAIATKGTALAEITPAIAKFLYELRAAGNVCAFIFI
jgi:hypothetical protein